MPKSYDGHKSNVNLGLNDWAKSEHIILFVLPAHTSHILQLMDIGCSGPFERIFNQMAHKFMQENCGQSISRYNICAIACPAYMQKRFLLRTFSLHLDGLVYSLLT